LEAVSDITKLKYHNLCIIVEGNPLDGLTFIGPFDSMDDAIAFGGVTCTMEWWIAKVHDPYEYT
jgi:hypothetical protein